MKKKSLKSLVSLLVAGSMLMPIVGSAQSTTTTATTTAQINSITSLIQQIQALQSQIDALKASQTTLQTQTATEFNTFLSDLSLGSRGDAVLALQALLAANSSIYPEGLITGFFGKATEKALKKLQKENGIEQAGRVGPKTRALLNRLLKDHRIALEDDDDDGDDNNDEDNDGDNRRTNRGKGKRPCAVVPPGQLIASGWLRKHDGIEQVVRECQKLPKGILEILDGRDGKPASTTPATTTPDTTAPNILGLVVRDVERTKAEISWTTNEYATSTLWYSTSSPMNTASASTIQKSTFKLSHSYDLESLVASTTYYYLIKVSDIFGNTATSIQNSFTTSN